MKLLTLAAALSTLCLTSCATTRVAAPVKPPADRMDCAQASSRPALPDEHTIDWSSVTTVHEARRQHEAFVRSVRTREGVVAGYIVNVEGQLFMCSVDAEWLRQFYEPLPDG
jgi:hypothetical protein